MAYIIAADFREASKKWYTSGLSLTTEEAVDADITAAIASMSAQFDQWTDDHFEDENEAVYTIDVREPSSVRLYMPRRLRSVTTLHTIDEDGTATLEAATKYRLHSSLNAAGTERVGEFDWLEIVQGERLSTTGGGWPIGTGTVRVTGDWSYLVTPDRVKKAVAILVYDQFKPRGDSLYRAQRWSTEGADYDRSQSLPSGLPDVDVIIAELRRQVM